ncbi:MAG: hypothetical protein ABIJ09_21135 [Pseudomonadota bacterium]
MIQDYPRSSAPTWQLVGKEAAAYVAAGLLFPLGLRDPRRRTLRAREQRTVVLVHGYLANRSSLLPLAAYLRWAGFKQILMYDYATGVGIEQAAIQLKSYLKRHVRGGRIDLVCHSLGGLVARVYLQQLGGERRVYRCVTLGTPHRGTYNAYWTWSRVGAELRPDSPLLGRLNAEDRAPSTVRTLSVIAGSDNMVIPRVFAGHDQEVCFKDLGHISMLFSPRVFRLVGQHLRA